MATGKGVLSGVPIKTDRAIQTTEKSAEERIHSGNGGAAFEGVANYAGRAFVGGSILEGFVRFVTRL